MYKIDFDLVKKIVRFEAKGFFQLNEAKTILEEFKETINKFKPQEAVLLTLVAELKPSSSEVIPIIQQIQVLGKEHFKKFASVQASGIANIQLKRVSEKDGANDVIKRFNSEDEAMKYLFE